LYITNQNKMPKLSVIGVSKKKKGYDKPVAPPKRMTKTITKRKPTKRMTKTITKYK